MIYVQNMALLVWNREQVDDISRQAAAIRSR